MARRPVQPVPPAPPKQLTITEMRRGIERLRERVSALEAFTPSTMTIEEPPEVAGMQVDLKGTLERIFGHDTSEYRRFESACDLQWQPTVVYEGYPTLKDYQEGVREKIAHSRAILAQAIRFLDEEITDTDAKAQEPKPAVSLPLPSNEKVFVVHGREEGPREAVARYLERLGLEPVILHEKANQGRTVIEKVEAHSDVGFAVIILTPDDEGALKGEVPQPRARQNVLLELGYFIGKLTRKRVCTLKVGELEIPSDWRGVVDEPYDAGGGWKQTLARELQAAGYEIDWNKVMRQ